MIKFFVNWFVIIIITFWEITLQSVRPKTEKTKQKNSVTMKLKTLNYAMPDAEIWGLCYIWWILIFSHFSRYTSGGLLTRLCQFTTENFSTDEKAHEVENFFKENHNPAERTIRQCVENITLNAKWHAKDGKSIRNYLGALWNLTLFWHNYWWPIIYWRKIFLWSLWFHTKKITFRISNICFNFFNCACLCKPTTNIQNSTRPNQWAAMDIRKLFLAFISRILLFWQLIYI